MSEDGQDGDDHDVFSRLPEEIWRHVTQYLYPEDLVTLSRVNRTVRFCVQADRLAALRGPQLAHARRHTGSARAVLQLACNGD